MFAPPRERKVDFFTCESENDALSLSRHRYGQLYEIAFTEQTPISLISNRTCKPFFKSSNYPSYINIETEFTKHITQISLMHEKAKIAYR